MNREIEELLEAIINELEGMGCCDTTLGAMSPTPNEVVEDDKKYEKEVQQRQKPGQYKFSKRKIRSKYMKGKVQ